MRRTAGRLVLGMILLGCGVMRAEETPAPRKAPAKPGAIAPTLADVAYGPHERHRLDLWQARSETRTPLVVFIHGGGWHGGEKDSVPAALVRRMLDAGVSVASINYRFTRMARLPAPLHDAARALQFLRSRADEWNLDAARFGAIGVSAGGCSSLWLAYHDDLADVAAEDPVARQSSRLAVAVGLSAQSSLEPALVVEWIGPQVLQHPMIRRAVGVKTVAQLEDEKLLALLREASPIRHVTRDDPPVLLVYPTRAKLPAENTGSAIHHAIFGEKLREAALAAGLECRLRIEDNADESAPRAEEFLLKHLKPAAPAL